MSYVYIDFQCQITHSSGNRIMVHLQDRGTEGKTLACVGLTQDGLQVSMTPEQSTKALQELRKCMLDFLPNN